MTRLSPNFTLEELVFSQTALRMGITEQYRAPPSVLENLTRLCAVLLEPARIILAAHFGRTVPLHVDSGYRSPEVNSRVGGATGSAHMDGRAADVVPVGVDLAEAFDVLRTADLPYDQVIFECHAWIHLAIAAPATEPRHMAMTATGSPGAWRYAPA